MSDEPIRVEMVDEGEVAKDGYIYLPGRGNRVRRWPSREEIYLAANGEERRCWRKGWTEVKCCGEWLWCGGFTNTCERCGADYNWAGQRLASRLQWGEETGESLSEILSIP